MNHPAVEIRVITSESRAGDIFSDVHPFFEGLVDYKLIRSDEIDNYELDLVFLALPHGVSMEFIKRSIDKPYKIIDLSGDFRLNSPEVYKEWYHKEHIFHRGFKEAVYGLPELYFDEIKNTRLIANPGCYPTSAILGLAPLLSSGYMDNSPGIIDSKSGVSGAGAQSKPITHFSNVNDNFKAYGLKNHRHTIEIQEKLEAHSRRSLNIQFTPHLLPVDRGILSTIYLLSLKPVDEKSLRKLYQGFYQSAPFVRIRHQPPSIKDVRGTNYCDIYITYDERTQMIMIISVIDNLVKGAAGQAVQNMNILFGLEETIGLDQLPVNP